MPYVLVSGDTKASKNDDFQPFTSYLLCFRKKQKNRPAAQKMARFSLPTRALLGTTEQAPKVDLNLMSCG